MICWMDTPRGLHRCDSLIQALELPEMAHPVIVTVGGGGKSSTLAQLAREYAGRGKRVIWTTTTHIHWPGEHTAPANDPQAIDCQLKEFPVLTVGMPDADGRLGAVDEDTLVDLRGRCDVLLVEADGARMLPFKCPAGHEPVIPACATTVIGVAGLNALGEPFSQKCHRWELAVPLLGVAGDDLIEPEQVAWMLASPQGQRKDVQCRYRVLINKADDLIQLEKGRQIAACLRRQGIEHCCIAALQREEGPG